MKRALHSIGPDGKRRSCDVSGPITQEESMQTREQKPRTHIEQPPPSPPEPEPSRESAPPPPVPPIAPTPKTTTGIMAAQLPSGAWQCILFLDGAQHTKGPMPRRLFLREYHRALEQLNERVLRSTGAPRG